MLFWTGALPALLVVYVRRNVEDAPQVDREREQERRQGSLCASSGRPRPAADHAASPSLLSTGVQGGYYTLATWVPTYLKTERGLTVVGTGGYLAFLISGAFVGYLTGGYLTDRLGRKNTFGLFAVLERRADPAVHPASRAAPTRCVLFLGFPLGFCTSAIFSGFGSYLAELYPTGPRHRAGLHLQLRPRGRRVLPHHGRVPRRELGRRRRDGLRRGRLRVWSWWRCSGCRRPRRNSARLRLDSWARPSSTAGAGPAPRRGRGSAPA